MTENNNIQKVAVILPAYNEEKTIRETIISFFEQLPEAYFYVINNASKDRTEEITRETFKEIGCQGDIIFEGRKGKGNAIRRAFLNIEADIYVMSDADTTYPANCVHDLIAVVSDGKADMAVGDRHSEGHYEQENKRMMHGFGNALVRNLVNFFFRTSLKDIMSGYRVFNRRFVKNYPILIEAFELETDMTLHALDRRFNIIELPVPYKDRPVGSTSKLNTYRDGVKVIFTILQILRYYKPLFFFGSLSFCFAFGSLAIGMPVLLEWLETGLITHIPLAILATGIGILAAISLTIAIVLDSVVYIDKKSFELKLLSESNTRKYDK